MSGSGEIKVTGPSMWPFKVW